MADTTFSFRLDRAAPPAATLEDHLLAEGLRAGEESAYEALLQRFENPIYGVIHRLMDDPVDAPDVVQEVFLKVFRNIDQFRGDSSLKTWIYRIAVNEARNHHRWFGRHRSQEVRLEQAAPDLPSIGDRLEDPTNDPFQITLDREVQQLIEDSLKTLSSHQRAVLVLRELEGLSYDEISEILEISLGTVKSRILRGREALRQEVARRMEPSHSDGWSLHPHPQGSDVV